MQLKTLKTLFFNHAPFLARVELMRQMPATYNLLRIKPVNAWLNVTDNCNMRCVMCNQWKETKENELSIEEWKGIIKQLAETGIKNVQFGGGEPLLVKHLNQLIAYGKSLDLKMGITTSGFLLTKRRLEELLAAGIDQISISIDGTGEAYEAIRRRRWSNVHEAAKLISEAQKANKLIARMGFVLMDKTLDNYKDVQELAQQLELPLFISLVDSTPFFFQLDENANENWIESSSFEQLKAVQKQMVSVKDANPNSLEIKYSDIDFIDSYFKDPVQSKVACTSSQTRVMINGSGDVYGGCWSMGNFGNLREQSLKSILQSQKYLSAHKDMFYKNCPGCSCGYSENNSHSLSKQVKEFSYRLKPALKEKIGA
jgi:MoaA/NifB/PqqE/SkfB family radical SAM enzyme